MRLEFDDWIEKQGFATETVNLFKEGIICYKSEAYRASLMFSFLGFQSILKERILISSTPEGYKDGEWDKFKSQLGNDEETWEMQVKEKVKSKKKSAFKISEDVYNQYFFWVNRRNDCAHAKGNYISYPHVEAFWLFIISNSPKFMVNGGKNSIISDLETHFDIHKTPMGKDILPLIKKIKFVVEKKDLREVFEAMKDMTLENNRYTVLSQSYQDMWVKIFKHGEVLESLTKYFVEDENRSFIKTIMQREPSLVKYFKGHDQFIRLLWIKEFSSYLDYYIFFEMLRCQLIPEEQLEEINLFMINEVDPTSFSNDEIFIENKVSEIDHQVLKKAGFFNAFYQRAFIDRKIVNSFEWGNRNKELVSYYLTKFPLDKEIVSAINSSFTTTYNPRHLNQEIIDLYKRDNELWLKHKAISEKNLTESLPKSINFIID